MSFEVGERHELVDLRRARLGALAETDRAHLGQRADRLREALADGEHAGDGRGATAPRPTSSTPSLPRAGAISSGGVTIGHYIMRKCACFSCARPSQTREPLPITMSGVRMGERLLQIGDRRSELLARDGGEDRIERHAAIVVAVTTSAADARPRGGGATRARSIDLRVDAARRRCRSTTTRSTSSSCTASDGLLASLDDGTRAVVALRECRRVLRHGGRVIVIEAGPTSGLRGAARRRTGADARSRAAGGAVAALQAAGFKPRPRAGGARGLPVHRRR